MQNEIKSVIKSLYLSAEEKDCGKYIGICRDINISSLCHSAGFQYLTANLDEMLKILIINSLQMKILFQ